MTAPQSPDLYIMPRQDGRRVYHLGSSGDLSKDGDPKRPHHLAPYVDGALNFINGHYWNSQATDRTNCPVVIRRTPDQIVAANQMFPYGDTGCKVGPPPAYAPFKGPMDPAWVTPYMPQTGERPDIGLITDASAYFMLGQTSAGMVAAAHAAGSFPVHFRDEKTDRPIDLLKYPRTNTNDMPGWGPPWLPRFPKNPDGSANIGGGLHPQQAHYPEMSYLAYMATLDFGLLEDLQYSANYTTFADANIARQINKAVPSSEVRGIAWGFRNLFMAHVATKDAETRGPLPNYLHPSSYWKALLDNALGWYGKFKDDPANQRFRLIGEFGIASPWTVDYLLQALAFGVLTGHSDWTPLYVWCLGNAIKRTNNDGEYPPGLGTAYRLITCPDGDISKPQYTWPEAIKAWVGNSESPLTQAQYDALMIDPMNGGKCLYNAESFMATRAVLRMANYLEKKGLVDVRGAYPDFDACLQNSATLFLAIGSVNARVSVIDELSTPQPPTEIEMSDTKLRVGETKHITLAITPSDADQTGLTYTASPDGLVTLAPDVSGVAVTRHAQGVATITASVNNLTATAEADDASPLALTIALSWDS